MKDFVKLPVPSPAVTDTTLAVRRMPAAVWQIKEVVEAHNVVSDAVYAARTATEDPK